MISILIEYEYFTLLPSSNRMSHFHLLRGHVMKQWYVLYVFLYFSCRNFKTFLQDFLLCHRRKPWVSSQSYTDNSFKFLSRKGKDVSINHIYKYYSWTPADSGFFWIVLQMNMVANAHYYIFEYSAILITRTSNTTARPRDNNKFDMDHPHRTATQVFSCWQGYADMVILMNNSFTFYGKECLFHVVSGDWHMFELDDITGFDAEACWPLNGPLFSPLNPLYSLMAVGVTGPPLSTNWSGRVLQAISSVM